jgi:hypothetical protein
LSQVSKTIDDIFSSRWDGDVCAHWISTGNGTNTYLKEIYGIYVCYNLFIL